MQIKDIKGKAGGERPPESETSAPARPEDIVLYVESMYEARRVVTDADTMLGIYIENLSGKEYLKHNATL